MEDNDRRKYPRVETSNLIDCCCLDEYDNELEHFMARVLNISPVGAKIESFKEIDTENTRLVAVDSEGVLIDIKGKVVYRNKVEDGRFEANGTRVAWAGNEWRQVAERANANTAIEIKKHVGHRPVREL